MASHLPTTIRTMEKGVQVTFSGAKNIQNIELKILRKFNLLLITLHNKCKNRVNCYRLLAKTRLSSIESFCFNEHNSNFLRCM